MFLFDWGLRSLAKVAFFAGRGMAAAGKSASAVIFLEKAANLSTETSPIWRQSHEIAAKLLQESGRIDAAVSHYRSLTHLNDTQSWQRLAKALSQSRNVDENVDEAIKCWRHILTIDDVNLEAHKRLAELLCQRGAISEAMPHLRALAESAPSQIRPWAQLARILRQCGDQEAEIFAWQRVLVNNRVQNEAHTRLAALFMATKRPAEAMPHLRTLANLSPHMVECWVRLAQVTRELNDADSEIAAWQQVLRINKNHPIAHRRLAQHFQRRGQWKDAIRHLHVIAATNPKEIGPRIVLAKAISKTKAYQAEVAAWRQVLSIDKANREAHERLAQLFARQREALPHIRALIEAAPGEVKPRMQLAQTLREIDETALETDAWRAILTIDATNPEAHRRLSDIYKNTGCKNEAIYHLRILSEIEMSATSPQILFARSLQKAEFREEEVAVWREILITDKGNGEAHHRLAQLLQELGRPGEAIPHLQFLARAGAKIKPWLRLVHVMREIGDQEREAETWEQILTIAPTHAEAHERLAHFLQRSGRKVEAIAHLRALAEILPGEVKPWIKLAKAQQEEGNQRGALEAWEQVLAVAPTHVEAHERLAHLFWGIDRKIEAISHLRALADISTGEAKPWLRLARALQEAGNHEAAIDAWQQVLAITPSNWEAHQKLVDLYRALERRAETVPHLRALAEALPDRPSGWQHLARTLKETGDAEGELAAWHRVIAAAGDLGEAHHRVSQLRSLAKYRKATTSNIESTIEGLKTAGELSEVKYHFVPDIYGRSAHKLIDIRSDELFYNLARDCRAHGRTLLYFDRLHILYQALANLARARAGMETILLMEIGVYKGGSSYFLASCAEALFKDRARQYSIDTFLGHLDSDLPAGAEGGHLPQMFNDTEYEEVKSYLSTFSFVTVLKGRIQDLAIGLGINTFDLIHLDVDIYEPTAFALEYFAERVSQGGMVIVDDYGFISCPGVRKAVDEHLNLHPAHFAKFELLTGQCLLIRR